MRLENKILPSLLSADFSSLGGEVETCAGAGADILHVDVMDGHFVPNITIGPLVVSALRPKTKMPIDCHLMIENPDQYVPDFAKAGADYISVHAEATRHAHRSLSLIKSFGVKAGLALNPATPLEYAFEAAEFCDFILLMTVNPGFGGQQFISSFYRRCAALVEFLDGNGLGKVEIEVDGGVKIENAKSIAEAGANLLVCGSGLFNGDLSANIAEMKKQLK